jgi:glutaredoxin-like protein NrdH
MTVELLSKPACMQCDATHMTLEDMKVKFTKKDMTQDAEALALAKSFGFMQAPVVVVRNAAGDIVDKWSGFRPEKIAEYA